MSFKPGFLIALAFALHAFGGSCAGATEAPQISFDGFGTLGAVHSSEDQADFTSTIFKPDGAGHSHRLSADVDSLIGAQLTVSPTPRLSAVLQVVAEQNYDHSHTPHVEWANIKYQFTPDFSIRLGRSVVPTFMFSETRKVGYAFPWVRPPLEVYGLNPLTNIDGIDASYRLHSGKLVYTIQANAGRKDLHLADDSTATRLRNLWGISNTAEFGPLTAHVVYQRFFGTVPSINAFFDNFRQFGPPGVAIADEYDANRKLVTNLGVGVSYDAGRWLMVAEWAHNNTHSFLGRSTAWYASSGYRIGNLMPFVSYAQARANNLSDPGLDLASLPPSQVEPASELNATLNAILSTRTVQNTFTMGGRWDFMRNAALKMQWDHTRMGTGSSGLLINTQPGFQPGGRYSAISASVDFVF
jgi:hypothetical protein